VSISEWPTTRSEPSLAACSAILSGHRDSNSAIWVNGEGMQEDQTVSFQPMSLEGRVPWFVNLFVIYLLCVLLMTVVHAIRILWTLRKHRRVQEREAPLESVSQSIWELCHSKIRSIKNFSHLTLRLAALVLSWNATNILAGVFTEKAPSFPYVAGELAEALVPFLMGIIICSAQFSCVIFLESLVRRRRIMLDRKQPNLSFRASDRQLGNCRFNPADSN
jgi:NADH:ubiquinone oxidoreductase subunit 3 (subunit A)